MDSLENMKAKPTVANLSASGAGQPIFMHSNPNHLFQMLYGGISQGIRKRHEAQSSMFDRIEQLAARAVRCRARTSSVTASMCRALAISTACASGWARCPVICAGLRQGGRRLREPGI